MQPAPDSLTYQHLVTSLKAKSPQQREAALLKEIVSGEQWRIDAVMDAQEQGEHLRYLSQMMDFAAMFGRLETMQRLCREQYFEGHRPGFPLVHRAFEIAAIHDQYDVARYLAMCCNAKPDLDIGGYTPRASDTAIEQQDAAKIDFLLAHGGRASWLFYMTIRKVCNGQQSLDGNKVLAHLLQKGGVDLDGYDSPFGLALEYRRNDVARYLLSLGSNPAKAHRPDELFQTAINNDNLEMIEVMLGFAMKPPAYARLTPEITELVARKTVAVAAPKDLKARP